MGIRMRRAGGDSGTESSGAQGERGGGTGNSWKDATRASEGSGPFSRPLLNGALSQAFGADLSGLDATFGDAGANEAIGADAHTRGSSMSFGDGLREDPSDAHAMEVIGHETAHALADGGSGQTMLDKPGDAGEQRADEAGKDFAAWAASGFEGEAPSLAPATGGRSAVHRHSSRAGTLTGVPMLRSGSQGSQVRTLQTLLNAHGSSLGVDGDFGPATERAVRSFQSSKGLTVDGLVGPQTAGALNRGTGTTTTPATPATPTAPTAAPAPASGQVSGSPALRRGSKGPAVNTLQAALNSHGSSLRVDGDFGPATERAVRSFQASGGLTVDGIVGPQTAGALNRAQTTPVTTTPTPTPEPEPSRRITGDPALRRGAQGPLVSELQQLLNGFDAGLSVDGDFGSVTERAVRGFQAANSLSADGVVGPATAPKLYDSNSNDIAETPAVSTPAPVPPGSVDVGDADPRGVLSNSNVNSTVRAMARDTALQLQSEGYRPYIFETYRSFERQDELYNRGGVTQVRGGGSWHNYGLAVDIVFYNTRGTGPSWDSGHAWSRVGAIGKSKGFTRWGGDWGWDMPHLEYHPGWGNSAYGLADTARNQGLPAVWERVGA